ncbi:helix-turn-helix transcriptional regulator [Flavobacterium sp.]|uniref:helix-turn-helix domain-containing protein n=1 Tax=Flavobacterium sp. TaxID=239 RepID=UPI00262FC19D|nr:helix-turn-helix transcriptional regulator [Flavobacterium sp.]
MNCEVAVQQLVVQGTLGERLRIERKRLGFTQANFASKVGSNRIAVLRYELGERCPDANFLLSCQSIGVNIFYVLNGEFEPRLDFERTELSVKFLIGVLKNIDKEIDTTTLTASFIQYYLSSNTPGLIQD